MSRIIDPDTGKRRMCPVCGKPAQAIGSYTYCSWACVDAPAVPAPEGMEWDDSEFVTKLVWSDTRREVARIYITALTRTANSTEFGENSLSIDLKHDRTVPGAKRAILAYLAEQSRLIGLYRGGPPTLEQGDEAEGLDVERIVTAAFNARLNGDGVTPPPSIRNWIAQSIVAGIREYARQTRKGSAP